MGSKEHLVKMLQQMVRFDSRKLDEFRKVSVEVGVSKNAEGSARVKIGNTEVIAGVKLAIDKPYPDTPDQGNLIVGVELSPMASPEFETGPPEPEAVEMARVVDRGIRESGAIDTKKLCIQEGEKAWLINVDIIAINDEGNLMDASGLATMAALTQTFLPKLEGDIIDYKELTKNKLPLVDKPVGVTVIKIGDKLLIDPSSEEEKAADARLTVTTQQDGKLCALQKGGDFPVSFKEIEDMIELGVKKSRELAKYLP